MKKLAYFFLKGWFYVLSLQPLPLLYAQAAVMRLFVFRIFGYRKKVVRENLAYAFPEKSAKEREEIALEFFRHFSHVLVETIKLMSISPKNLKKRIRHLNPEVIPDMIAHGGGGIAVFAHYANWEWLGSGMGLQLPFPTAGIYKPLKNKVFDQLVFHIRTRLGNDMIPQKQALRETISRLKKPYYIAFLGDQIPFPGGPRYWTPFMNRPAAVHLGIAHIALKRKVPLFYFDVRKVKRGYYTVELRQIPIEPFLPFSQENVARLTDAHVEMLEEILHENPAYWLWSHKRWKHAPKPGDSLSPKLDPAEFPQLTEQK